MHGRLPFLAKPNAKPSRQVAGLQKATIHQIIDRVAMVLKRGEPTAFAYEAATRHGLRASFCMLGWRWEIADLTAARIVSAALAQIGATRPTWQAGQPEYAQDGVIVTERTRCLNCGSRLPEGYFKFCCRRCKRAYERDLAYYDEQRAGDASRAVAAEAYRAAYRANAEPRACPECGARFKPSTKVQIYCSQRCSRRVNSRKSPWRTGAGAVSSAAGSFRITPTPDKSTVPRGAAEPISMDCARALAPKRE